MSYLPSFLGYFVFLPFFQLGRGLSPEFFCCIFISFPQESLFLILILSSHSLHCKYQNLSDFFLMDSTIMSWFIPHAREIYIGLKKDGTLYIGKS